MNLSAPFIPQFFKVQVEQLLPFVDIVIGNDAEASAWAGATGFADTENIPAIARALAELPKANAARPRIVVITRGHLSTIVVSSAEPDKPREYPINALSDSEIVDTNGAGDAFAGGFIGALILGKDLDDAVEVGHKMGGMCVQQVRGAVRVLRAPGVLTRAAQIGPQFKWPKVQVV